MVFRVSGTRTLFAQRGVSRNLTRRTSSTVALFSRRTLQRMLDEVATFEQRADIEQQVRVLNRGKDQSIDVEWEVAVLYGLSRSARVQHHAALGDGVRLDAVVSRDSARVLFAADIAAISESGRRDLNPVDYLHDELLRRVRQNGLRPEAFSIYHEGRREGPPGKEVMRLLVPGKRDVPTLFGREFAQFLRGCLAAPDQAANFRRFTETVHVEICYNPAQRYFTGGGPALEASYSLTKNPVHNALIRKAKQLRRAALDLPVGIILCAVDTSLSDKTPPKPAINHSAGDIVRHFLSKNRSISFVVTLEVTERYLGYMRGISPPTIQQYVHLNSDARESRLSSDALQTLERLADSIPRPVNTGMNALNHLNGVHPNEGRSHDGSFKMAENTLRISSRTLLDYLSGQISPEKFSGEFQGGPIILRLFEGFRKAGRSIERITIERDPDFDDDWVTFHFDSAPDPAIAKFRAPLPLDQGLGRGSREDQTAT